MASNVQTTPDVPASKSSLSNLQKLSPSVYLHRPEPDPSVTNLSDPKLILLATWMDAREPHIAKYISRYEALYPTACILVVRSYFRYYFSDNAARNDLAPAVPVIREIVGDEASTPGQPSLLVHLFSNGGSCMLYHLYDLYSKTQPSSTLAKSNAPSDKTHLLPLHVTIFDSVPGRWTYTGSTQAVLLGLPQGLVRTLAWPLVHLLGLFWVVKYRLLWVPEETHVWGLAHNDSRRAREACRAYVYSEADEFVDHGAVEEHADHAEASGFVVVRRDKYVESKHVAHARADPDRYWSLVRETWETAQQAGRPGK